MSGSWRLRVERGPNAGQSFAINQAETTIGRQENNTVMLDDARLSRQHARIQEKDGTFWILNLSPNGTRVNHALVDGPQRLSAGDRIYIEETVVVYQEDDSPTEELSRKSTLINRPALNKTP